MRGKKGYLLRKNYFGWKHLRVGNIDIGKGKWPEKIADHDNLATRALGESELFEQIGIEIISGFLIT